MAKLIDSAWLFKLPLFRWAAERRTPALSPTERTIAKRHNLSPTWARVICGEAGIGGRHD